MKDKLLEIINHYGVNHQQRKLNEEVFELQEAITIHELKKTVEYEIPLFEIIGTEEHIAEEISDVFVILFQLKEYYNIPTEVIDEIVKKKVDRQIERLKNENIKQ